MDPVWIGMAFGFGFAAHIMGLPPLVGYLVAGFVLNWLAVDVGSTIETFSELGVTLLLFSIGLKLKVGSLLRPEVWATASLHMLLTVLIYGIGIYGLAVGGLSAFAGLDLRVALLIAFALSFSSTVFAVKVLEQRGESESLHGRIAIGILIVQDIVAVVFLAFSTGKVPSPLALLLFALIPLRPVLMKLMDRSGHGELLILYGLLLAFGGGVVFNMLGVKADLGALILGILLASHPKSTELAKSLLGFKDLFLVGFFLSIGLKGLPTLQSVEVAVLLVALIPLKVALYFYLMTLFRLRARTATLASLSLANYSEFGLIVGAIAAANGWLSGDWLVTIAIALSLTFILASPLNATAHGIYAAMRPRLKAFERAIRLPYDQPIDPGDMTMGVIGMGRVGTGAYDFLRERYGDTVLGIERDGEVVETHRRAGRHVIQGDATDPDFWARLRRTRKGRVVLLTMPNYSENLIAVRHLKRAAFPGMIAAAARYPDEERGLRAAGVDAIFNFFNEAGVGFAEQVSKRLETQGGMSGPAPDPAPGKEI